MIVTLLGDFDPYRFEMTICFGNYRHNKSFIYIAYPGRAPTYVRQL